MVERFAPSRKDEPAFRHWWGRLERMSASPADMMTLIRMVVEIDLRDVLPTIRVPTLVLHRRGELVVPLAGGRYLAEHIPNAKLVELDGSDHWPWTEGAEELSEEIEEFLTGVRHATEPNRVLATVLFVDIVGSTDYAERLGDRRWRDLLESYYGLVERQIVRFGGRRVGTAGDGVFASFDGPARAVRCAMSVREAAPGLGINVRAGLHTGECEVVGDDLGGIAVHIGARICEVATPDEILVSSTLKDLVAGSGLRFSPRGSPPLKGVQEERSLFAVA
jgi:class 3 adenylate cyclase